MAKEISFLRGNLLLTEVEEGLLIHFHCESWLDANIIEIIDDISPGFDGRFAEIHFSFFRIEGDINDTAIRLSESENSNAAELLRKLCFVVFQNSLHFLVSTQNSWILNDRLWSTYLSRNIWLYGWPRWDILH